MKRRLAVSLCFPLAAALGSAAAIEAPAARADTLPGLPVTTPSLPPAVAGVPLPPLPLPPTVVTPLPAPLPAPTVVTPLPAPLPAPTVVTPLPAPTTGAAAPAAATSPKGDAATTESVVLGLGGRPTNSRPTATTRVAGAVRLTNGLTSIPVSSVVLPARLVIEQVRLSPATVSSRGATFTAQLRIRDSRGYVVRGARVEMRNAAGRQTLLGPVRLSALDGRLVSTAHVHELPPAKAATLRLVIRAYKAAGHPVGGVAAHARAAIRIAPRR